MALAVHLRFSPKKLFVSCFARSAFIQRHAAADGLQYLYFWNFFDRCRQRIPVKQNDVLIFSGREAPFLRLLEILLSRVFGEGAERIADADLLVGAKLRAAARFPGGRAPDGFKHVRRDHRRVLMQRK